jgi:hypothetical protein
VRITLVYGALASGVEVTRTLDGRRHRLVISCGWRQPPLEVWQLAAPYLNDEERAELAEALGLERPGGGRR